MADAATQPARAVAPADLGSLEKRLRKLEAVVGTAPPGPAPCTALDAPRSR